jgi:exosortase A-associated hydrolase 1
VNSVQRALRFPCRGCHLVGVLDVPERPLERGVLIVNSAGGYRAGPHRHQTLVSRQFAARGLAALRFDPRGSGDSAGAERADDSLQIDITAAMKELFIQVPDMKESVIWALGDAAVAAAQYACSDERVAGLVLLNPRCPGSSMAAPRVAAPVRLGELPLWRALSANTSSLQQAMAALRHQALAGAASADGARRLLTCLECFDGHVLLLLGSEDLSAHVFDGWLPAHPDWQRIYVGGADPTFATRAWRDQAGEACANWIATW